ncbi:hypothetical protein [Bdellovibrio sp. HCB-110]|uniref:hypothetical protein n=1 Tax=Bdellovibrio sp. HCB-110 TaxID=3391182 RepID=UPI0039B4D3BE
MKWKLKPVSLVKQFAAGISVVTMCISPIAEGAAAASQKKLINQYLKETGLTTKKLTVGEYWGMVRHVYPDKLQTQMDEWVRLNRNELMPSIEATSFKDAEGNEQVRLTLTKDGQSATLTFTGDEDKPLKVNSVSFSKKELMNYNNFNDIAAKLAKQDPAIAKSLKTGKLARVSKNSVLSWDEYKKLSPRQRAEYMVRMRMAMEAADKVLQVRNKYRASYSPDNKYEYVLQVLFGDAAYAGALTGQNCIIAGYISKYGKDDSCGSEKKGGALNADLRGQMEARKGSCSGNQVACNPLVYGFKAGGASYCVGQSEMKYATANCNKQSPVGTPQDKKRIIESYLEHAAGKKVDLKLNEEGKIPEEQKSEIDPFLSELKDMLNDANAKCNMVPLKDIKKAREEQDSACRELQTRMIALETFAVIKEPPSPPLPLPDPSTGTCNDQTGGATPTADGKGCKCPEGQKEGEGGICVVIETGGNGDLPGGKDVKKEDSCGFWCRNKNWIIPVGVGAAALGLFWWLFKKDSKAKNTDPVYVPPAPVPEPTATTSPTTPIVEPPPPAPCPAPNSMINGVCTPPVIVPPPTPTTSEGGTKTDEPGRAGGVR